KDNPRTQLTRCIAAVQAVAAQLDIVEDADPPDISWRFYFSRNTPFELDEIPDADQDFFLGPSTSLGITQEMIDAAEIIPEHAVPAGASHEELEALYHSIVDTQRPLVEHLRNATLPDTIATDVFDYQYLIIRWLEMLDGNRAL